MSEPRLQSLERIGVPILLVFTMLASTVVLAKRFADLEHGIVMLGHEMKVLRNTVDAGTSTAQARAWIEVFRAKNPNINVPDLPPR